MTPDERKEYNKSYYQKRKVDIIKNGCLKVQCEFCKNILLTIDY
jgi:hypothetical protein